MGAGTLASWKGSTQRSWGLDGAQEKKRKAEGDSGVFEPRTRDCHTWDEEVHWGAGLGWGKVRVHGWAGWVGEACPPPSWDGHRAAVGVSLELATQRRRLEAGIWDAVLHAGCKGRTAEDSVNGSEKTLSVIFRVQGQKGSGCRGWRKGFPCLVFICWHRPLKKASMVVWW